MSERIKNLLILVNPISGRGLGGKYAGRIVDAFTRRNINVDLQFLTGPGSPDEILSNYEKPYDAIAAVGGDGSIAEIGDAIYKHAPAKPMGLIPLGLSNCLARHFELPEDIEACAEIISHGKTKNIDVMLVNGKVALSFISAGFDAEVVRRTAEGRKGPLSNWLYAKCALSAFLISDWPLLKIEVDGETIEGRFYQAVLSPIDNYAKYFKLFKDGEFTLYLFRGRNRFGIFRTFLRSGLGLDLVSAADEIATVKDYAKISSEQGTSRWQYDGEAGGDLPLQCRIVKDALRITAP